MRPRVVVDAYEAPVLIKQVRFYFVRFMERFYLANRCGPAYAGSDMLDSKVLTVQFELRCSPSGRLELCSPIGKYLFWNTIPFDSSLKQKNCVFSGWTPNLN